MHDVLTGRAVTSKWIKLAVRRHLDDMRRQMTPGFDYYFDRGKADRAVAFFDLCHHYQGRTDILKLEPWQQWVVAMLYGWSTKQGGRRFTTSLVAVGKKNGKSTMAAPIGLKGMIADGEPGAEVYAAATTRDQASKIWQAAVQMVQNSPALKKRIKLYKHSNTLVYEPTASLFKPVSSDANTLDGLHVHVCLLDEYHQHKDSSVYNILHKGTVGRLQPLFFIISTAGLTLDSPLYPEWEYALDVVQGIRPDERYFAAIYTIDDEDDWKDRKVWYKANPNLGVSIPLENFEAEFTQALNRPEKESEFKAKNLNQWTQTQSVWIKNDVWETNQGPVDVASLDGRVCFAAFDLSEKWDLTGWTLCFPPNDDEEKYQFIHHAWVPEATMFERIKRDRQPYDVWVRDGWLHTTPGDRIDHDFIEQQIYDDSKRYDIREVPYDPYAATQLVRNLEDNGLPVVEYQQGWKTMSPATKDFEDKAYAGLMAHGGNPILTWMISCVVLWKGSNDQVRPVKPDRGKSRKRIDLVITSIMSLDRAVRHVQNRSVYEDRGIEFI